MLLLERNIALGVLELAHDLHSLSFGLADVEAECVTRRPDGHDAQTDPDLDILQLVAPLQVLVIQKEVWQPGVGVELVRVGIRVFRGSQCVDLVGSYELLVANMVGSWLNLRISKYCCEALAWVYLN